MRKRLLQIVLLMLIPFTYSVADTTENIELNGVKYTLKTSEDPYLTEPRRYAFVTGFTSKTITIPEEISYGGNNYDVVCQCISCLDGFYALESLNSEITLGNGNFRGHSAIKSVTMPFPYEPKEFFYGCNNLEEVTITNNNTSENFTIDLQSTFYSCEKLKKVTITADKSVNLISTFSNCISLETVSMTNLKVIGITDAFSRCTNLKEITLPNTVNYIDLQTFAGCTNLKKITIPSNVTTIGERAFYGCTNLASVEMSNSVTTIEHRAFYGCIGLVSVKLSNNIKSIESETFYGCTSLKEITIPNGVTYIGENAFENCTSLNSIIIPNSVTTIGSEAFRGCTSLASINSGGYKWNSVMLPTKLEAIKKSTFYGCTSLGMVNIPNSVTSIGSNAFYGCTGIESAIISNKVTTIEERAFSGCSSLKEVTIPNSVTTIGTDIFYNCTSLESAKISNGLTTTGYSTFYGCTSLTSVEIPNSVNTIGSYSFYNCKSLPSIEIPNSVTTIEGSAFMGCTSLKEVTIPNSVTTIGDYIFSGCTSLESAKLSNGLTTTGYNTFYGCTSLTSVEIPNSVTTIGECSFDGCLSLVSIEIPNSVTTIGKLAFANCKNLKKMNPQEIEERFNLDFINPPTSLKEIGGGAFNGCNSIQYLSLPNSLTSIDEYAFMKCKNLLAVVSKIKVPFAIPNNVFLYEDYSTTTAYLWVPMESIKDYENCDGWKVFDPNIGIYGDADLPLPGKPDGSDDVTITANSYTINYGDELPEFEYTTTGAALHGTPEITCEATKTSPVGTYPIVISKGTVTNTKTTFVNGTLTITKAPLTIKAGNYTKVEGEANPTFTLTYEGFKNNETSAVLTKQPTVSCSATKDSPAGDYPVTVSGAEAQNYEISYVAGTLTITANSGGDNPELNDGDVFTAMNADGVELTFQVISAADKTCQVVRQGRDSYTIVTKPVPESIVIPAEAKGFKVIAIGYQAFYGAKGIKSVIIPEGVTSIDTHAFRECYNLASFTFPKSLEECGTDSFEDCAFGATVHISDLEAWCNVSLVSWGLYGWHLFLNGEEVNDLVIPNGVTSIGESMALVSPLTNCASLTSVTIPASVTKMYAPFSGCSNLTSVTTFAQEPVAIFTGFPNATNSITNATLYVPKGSKVAYEAADYWKDFKEILEIEDETPEDIITFADPKVKAICVVNWDTSGDGELSKTEAAAVTSLGDVFMGNSEITSFDELQYFTGLTTIPDYAFSGCGSLKSIRLPKSLTSIGEYAFEDCTSLETVVSFIETPFELGEGAFCAWENDRHKFDLHFSLYVPIGTKELYRAAGWDVDENHGDYRTILSGTPENPGSFTVDGIVYDPIDATTVELIDGKNASGDVTIPSMVANSNVSYQVTEIGACAFKGNTSLTSIVIPNCVKAIRPFAFNGCTGLTTVISYIETPFYLGLFKGVFLNNENVVLATYLQLTLYVPAGTKSLYEQASWTDASRIVEVGGDAYAVFDSTTGTLTFKCGEKPSGDNVYDAEDTGYNPGWQEHRANLKKVEFDKSFAFARPMSTYSWFKYTDGIEEDDPLTEIVGLQYLNTSNVTDMGSMFYGCNGLTSLNISNFDTSKAENMYFMFGGCKNLSTIDLSNFDTGNVTNMSCMFSSCSGLMSLDLSGFNTSNVTNMSGMFGHCTGLASLDLSNFNTNKVTDMSTMFRFCRSLTILDLRHFDTSNVTNMYWMFYYSNMSRIYVSDRWSTEKVTNGSEMFYLCANLVGGQGTKYDYNHSDYTYAHIDGGADNPGYFTSAGKLGDANDDGYVNMTDVNAVKDYIMKGKTEGFIIENADMNGDNEINAADIVKILNIIKSIGN